MIKTAADLSPAEIEKYARGLRAQAKARRQELEARRERAWEVARRAAALLKERFEAKQVKVFGSLTNPYLFHKRSDVDLAVWGLNEKEYYRAVGSLLNLSLEFEIDLIEVEFARPRLLAVIERDGILL